VKLLTIVLVQTASNRQQSAQNTVANNNTEHGMVLVHAPFICGLICNVLDGTGTPPALKPILSEIANNSVSSNCQQIARSTTANNLHRTQLSTTTQSTWNSVGVELYSPFYQTAILQMPEFTMINLMLSC